MNNKTNKQTGERLYSLTKDEQATEDFTRAATRKSDAQSKDQVQEFLWVVKRVTDSGKRSFTFSDIQSAAKATQIDNLSQLFSEWCRTMVKHDKLISTPTIYDEELFTLIG